MRLKDLSQEKGMIHKIKVVMEMTNLPEQDFTDRVMNKIVNMENVPAISRKAPVITMKRFMIAVGVICLLSGFSYAATAWFNLHDNAGNIVLEVRKTNTKIPDWQTRILEEVQQTIAPGESAVVYFGSKEEIVTQSTDQILWTSSPREYRDQDEFNSTITREVRGPLTTIQRVDQVPEGYEFEAGYLLMNYLPTSQEDDQLTFAKSSDGKEYAYGVRLPGNVIQSIAWKYRKDRQEVDYQVHFVAGDEKSKFFDMEPSKDSIIKVAGIETYYYDRTLNWVVKSEGGFMNYRLFGPAATKEQLVDFAKAILTH
ncbi:hypothetical protein [Paenibacillus segetis]|uniref:DUF4367 domain-containing protein n=1 Tax=Paenibacillus segetis TaxID=1325360 RepID=A0ABQ1YBG6_9BACL|nr:hypothetical protein [Paenibacillus segetis]GGH19867.1 hypothetical protein GCM10008013_16850 [Paenibacillus segetis]